MKEIINWRLLKRLIRVWRWHLGLLSGFCLALLLVLPVPITAKVWPPDEIYKAAWFATMRPFTSGKGEGEADIDPLHIARGTIVWVYLRHSPGRNQDIASQKAAVERFAEEQGLIIGRIFCDERASGGSTKNREQFNLMTHLARQKPRPADMIIFWDLSRFAREIDDSQFFRSELRRNGWKLFSMMDDIPDNPFRYVFEALIDWKNHQFRTDLGKNTKRGLRLLAEQGFVPVGPVAKGYASESVSFGVRADGTPRFGRKPFPDPKLAPLAIKAFELRAHGAPYAVISEATHLFGPEPSSWRTFFHNRIYIGEYEYDGRIYKNIYPALISTELFDAVQKQMPARKESLTTKRFHPRRKGSSYYLADKSVCGYCHAPMEGKKIDQIRYYVCSRRNERMELCPQAPLLPADELEVSITGILQQHVLSTEYLQSLLTWTNEHLNQGLAELQLRVEATQKGLADAKSLAKKFGYNFGKLPEYSSTAAQLLLEQDKLVGQLEKELGELKDRLAKSRIDMTLEELESYVSKTQAMLNGGEFFDLRELCEQMFSRIVMTGDECRLELHFPVLKIGG
ncbi:MAG: recombinase family protein [Anaerolineae bacterium]|nr:recombinase family protein [Anaerolineae bacterium]